MKIMNSMQIQRHVWKVLYIQRVPELVRLVTVLLTASRVSSPAPPPALSPDVQHFDKFRRANGRRPGGGQGPNQQEEVQHAEESAPERNDGSMLEVSGTAVPPAGNGALPHRAMPRMDDGPYHRIPKEWIVPVQGTDAGALAKNCKHWKPQQKILWAEVRKDTRRGKVSFNIRTCSRMSGAPGRYWTRPSNSSNWEQIGCETDPTKCWGLVNQTNC